MKKLLMLGGVLALAISLGACAEQAATPQTERITEAPPPKPAIAETVDLTVPDTGTVAERQTLTGTVTLEGAWTNAQNGDRVPQKFVFDPVKGEVHVNFTAYAAWGIEEANETWPAKMAGKVVAWTYANGAIVRVDMTTGEATYTIGEVTVKGEFFQT